MKKIGLLGVALALALGTSACGGGRERVESAGGPSPAGPPAAERYAALPDTLICVVDRTTTRGLRDLSAKRTPQGEVVLLVSNQIRPLDELHPVNLIAGYAGRESWFTSGEIITHAGRRYSKYEGERRVPMEQVTQVGEYRAIPLYAGPGDSPPPAVYVPVRAGCIFQAYIREDLLRGR